jgi:hypothetical protein
LLRCFQPLIVSILLPLVQVERPITNQTYILRLHVTTQMAQLLFPPRADLEAAHAAAAAVEAAPSQRLGVGSTYTQLFKQRLTVVDEADRAWPVQVPAGFRPRYLQLSSRVTLWLVCLVFPDEFHRPWAGPIMRGSCLPAV